MADDNKVVSISFDNRQFMEDVSNTISAINSLNDATSGKNLTFDGLRNFQSEIDSLNRSTVDNVGDINRSLSQLGNADTFSGFTEGFEEASSSVSILGEMAIGALRGLGGMALDAGLSMARNMFAGLSDGWNEYNMLVDSTQTILANTERYGTTMDEITDSLDVLNDYADRTIYSFSDMTRNIGYFTTAGQDLEDSITAIQGMSNMGALFGADATQVARATYQMSQMFQTGYMQLMDWRSLENASMAGSILREELMNTAEEITGRDVRGAMEEAGMSFRDSLQRSDTNPLSGWLTSDIFLETLRKFQGQTREYWESMTDDNGMRLYTDEEIDELVQLGESANEAATKVRTLKMMIASVSESLGSGWAQTFRLIVGDLEQAKEFWTPINDVITGIIGGMSNFRNEVVGWWADTFGGREKMISDMVAVLTNFRDIIDNISSKFSNLFGSSFTIGGTIARVTDALGDMFLTLTLTEEEMDDLSDFVSALVYPLSILGDLLYELIRYFFDASGSMEEFGYHTDSVFDSIKPFRKSFMEMLGVIGRTIISFVDFVRNSELISNVITTLSRVISVVFGTAFRVIGGIIRWLYDVWTKYDITNKIKELWNNLVYFLSPITDLMENLGDVFYEWYQNVWDFFSGLNFTPLEDIRNVISSLIDIFRALADPSRSASDAFQNFVQTLKDTSVGQILVAIGNAFGDLWDRLKNSPVTDFFSSVADVFLSIWDKIKSIDIGGILSGFFGNVSTAEDATPDIPNGDSKIVSFLSFWKEQFDKIITSLSDSSLLDNIANIISHVFDVIANIISGPSRELENTPDIDDSAANDIERKGGIIETLLNVVSKIITGLLDWINGFEFDETFFNTILAGIKTGFNILLQIFGIFSLVKVNSGLTNFSGALKTLNDSLKSGRPLISLFDFNFGGLTGSLTNMLSTVSKSSQTIANSAKDAVKALKKNQTTKLLQTIGAILLGVVIAIIVFALLIGAGYGKDIAIASGVVLGIMVAVVVFIAILAHITTKLIKSTGELDSSASDQSKVIKSLSFVLLTFGALVLLISFAINNILKNTPDLWTLIVALLGMMGLIYVLCVSIDSMLSTISTNEIDVKSLIAVGATIGAASKAFVSIGLAFSLLLNAVDSADDISLMMGGFVAMTIMLLAIVASLSLLATQAKTDDIDNKTMLSIASSLLIASTSFIIIASALKTLASIGNVDDVQEYGIILGSLIGVIGLIIGGLMYLSSIGDPKTSAILSISLLVLSIVPLLLSISQALALLSLLDTNKLLGASMAVIRIVTIIGIIVMGMVMISTLEVNISAILAICASMIAITGSLFAASLSLMMLSTLDPDRLMSAVMAITAVLALMSLVLMGFALLSMTGIGTAGIAVAAAGLVAMSAAMLMLSAALLIASFGFESFVRALQGIETLNMEAIMENIARIPLVIPTMLMSILQTIPMLVTIFTAIFAMMIQVIDNCMPMILNSIERYLTGLIEIGERLLPRVSMLLYGLFWGGEGYPGIVPMAIDALAYLCGPDGLLKILNSLIDSIFSTPNGLLPHAMTKLEEFGVWAVPNIIDFAFDLILAFINGMADAIDEHTQDLVDGFTHLGESVLNAFCSIFGLDPELIGSSPASVLFDIGVDLLNGLINGIGSMVDSAVSTVTDLGDDMVNGLRDLLGIHSPSTVFSQIGTFITQGLSNGINGGSGSVLDTITSLGKDMVSQFSDSTSGMGDGLFSNFESPDLSSSLNLDTSVFDAPSPTDINLTGFENIGAMSGEAYNQGVVESIDYSSFNTAVSGINTSMLDDSITQPVIAPVMDLTNVQTGIGDIRGMFTDVDSIAIDAQGSFVTGSLGGSTDQATNGQSVINFTQYNTSPRELSRIEIYRDTQNAIRSVT